MTRRETVKETLRVWNEETASPPFDYAANEQRLRSGRLAASLG